MWDQPKLSRLDASLSWICKVLTQPHGMHMELLKRAYPIPLSELEEVRQDTKLRFNKRAAEV